MAGWRGHSTTEAMTILLGAIRMFMPLSETEYNGNCQDRYSSSCQDTVTFASHTGATKLMSKTNCPVKPACLLDHSGTGRHIVCPRSLTLTWKTYDTCLSKQLGQANSVTPCATDHILKFQSSCYLKDKWFECDQYMQFDYRTQQLPTFWFFLHCQAALLMVTLRYWQLDLCLLWLEVTCGLILCFQRLT